MSRHWSSEETLMLNFQLYKRSTTTWQPDFIKVKCQLCKYHQTVGLILLSTATQPLKWTIFSHSEILSNNNKQHQIQIVQIPLLRVRLRMYHCQQSQMNTRGQLFLWVAKWYLSKINNSTEPASPQWLVVKKIGSLLFLVCTMRAQKWTCQ